MRIAAMQPYFYPYIGYYQLIANVDCFVLLDDVQYIRRGWVNRNRIRRDASGRDWQYMTVPVKHAPQRARINQIEVADQVPWQRRLINTVSMVYGKTAEQHMAYRSFIENISRNRRYLLEYLTAGIRDVCQQLGLGERKILMSSSLNLEDSLRGKERILSICRLLDADTYLNPGGGTSLYDHESFRSAGVQLIFQPECGFEPHRCCLSRLSILDVLLSCELSSARQYVGRLIA